MFLLPLCIAAAITYVSTLVVSWAEWRVRNFYPGRKVAFFMSFLYVSTVILAGLHFWGVKV